MNQMTDLIDLYDFAEQAKLLSGKIDPKTLTRLSIKNGEIAYIFKGERASHQVPRVILTLDATLKLECQRCFESVPFDVKRSFTYKLGEVESEFDDNDEIDWLDVNEKINLLTLIEDELMAALPIAIMHDAPCVTLKTESGEKLNAFEILKKFKKP